MWLKRRPDEQRDLSCKGFEQKNYCGRSMGTDLSSGRTESVHREAFETGERFQRIFWFLVRNNLSAQRTLADSGGARTAQKKAMKIGVNLD
mgnify:CR=1 FL=1